ncbi:hypothetical protein FA13DRAFT_1816316 [Coprinellus micaceus]|uniref:Uncharacterized protein n=1 Tax=Coprinellus micaceus TaxID=71717 RepID=A0A4Y7T0F1_COPMI|nr:hypothetical protein FA13DRAFT_1816316 [Coprinellus micaceus]
MPSSSITSKIGEPALEKAPPALTTSTEGGPPPATSISSSPAPPSSSSPPLPLSLASLPPATSPQGSTNTADLRHMTSSAGLAMSSLSPTATSPTRPGRRTSQHLRTTGERSLGVGSPSSIPSSPTSIHSSSSAIFERDIEPMLPPSPPSHSGKPLDPHRIPRARNTEQLEQSVPSVLDSAAAILTSTSPPSFLASSTSANAGSPTSGAGSVDQVEVVAPVSSPGPSIFGRAGGSASGFASPLSLRSRSPSPGPRPDSLLLLNVPTSPQALAVPADGLDAATSPNATVQVPTGAVPMGRSVSTSSSYLPSSSSPPAPYMNLGFSSHPPSPSHVHQPLHHSTSSKRLSFMSYSDLLTSTPASTHTLNSLTSGQTGENPPPHIPSVSGLNLLSATASIASASNSVRGVSLSPIGGSGTGVNVVPMGGVTHPGKRDSIALLDNVGVSGRGGTGTELGGED